MHASLFATHCIGVAVALGLWFSVSCTHWHIVVVVVVVAFSCACAGDGGGSDTAVSAATCALRISTTLFCSLEFAVRICWFYRLVPTCSCVAALANPIPLNAQLNHVFLSVSVSFSFHLTTYTAS